MYEDLLTEIFADLLSTKKNLAGFCSSFIGETIKNPREIIINTQKTFLRLDNHEINSRPDLVIQFKEGDEKYVFFFENKVESLEGFNQLARYADHLKRYKDDNFQTFLFYLTKYNEVKNQKEIFKGEVTGKFIPVRWYMIYNWLKGNTESFSKKILEFMEEIGLNETRRFAPQDVYAIQEMSRLQRMMDECLDGPVDEKMTKLFGRPIGWSNRNVQLRDCDRYFKVNEQIGFWVGCGFYLTDDEYPLVSVTYEVSPKCEKRKEVIKSMRGFMADNPYWEGYSLDEDTEWSGISLDKSLLDFLHEEDHIISIQKFFIEKIQELHKIKQNFKDLGWK
jgi:hypothetical protein